MEGDSAKLTMARGGGSSFRSAAAFCERRAVRSVRLAWFHTRLFGDAVQAMGRDDSFNLAQSAAYSSVFALFPALVVLATLLPLLPVAPRVGEQLGIVLARLLPANVLILIDGYFTPGQPTVYHGTRALLFGAIVSIWGASGVIATFMEGIRRAYNLPSDCWSFVQRRARALILVFLSLLPLAMASLLVVFGETLANWISGHVPGEQQRLAYLLALLVRWVMAATGSVGVIALLYSMGAPLRQRWQATLPGALLATSLWLLLTIGFGLYVTHFARYNAVYGSLAAGVALLVWLYLVSLSVLCGAEFNGQLRVAALRGEAPVPAPSGRRCADLQNHDVL